MSAATDELRDVIDAYNDAWNAHDVERIASMHAPDMVFENHTAGERAQGEEALAHIGGIFAAWPDIEFRTRRLYVREDLVVQEWTASATHTQPLRRGELARGAIGRARRVGGDGHHPVRGRQGEAQGRLLRLGVDPAPGRAPVGGASCARAVRALRWGHLAGAPPPARRTGDTDESRRRRGERDRATAADRGQRGGDPRLGRSSL